MNIIHSFPINELGYNFIDKSYLPEGADEYYLRNTQQSRERSYRSLTQQEIELLVQNGNTSNNWNDIFVTEGFDASLIHKCRFYGLIRIGKLDRVYREFHNLRLSVGFYNSTIISCDLGDNICIHNVRYLSHYIIEDDVMLSNIDELATTDNAKFGTGILKQGEESKQRVQLELCNENAGRAVIPFEGMLPGDAYIWSRFRDDEVLQQKFLNLTEGQFDKRRGFYGKIGERTIIKSTRIIKDTHIGSDAYIKGANKLKNLTIRSDKDRRSQIGEGCELVNGIIGYGCRIFYGVKAVRFITAAHSQLKYGARLINSYLGNNATISCCEVLNSLIFPAHEQHHNNSFLCASLLMGQSNIAAGATIGSNHNSRAADGEIIAGRGFWPGLCVSLKHNSIFASFTILAKGDYPAELNIKIPFALVSNDVSKDRLVVHPAYWFRYNMYALERNSLKYVERDKRTDKIQQIDYDYLAPDTINEMIETIQFLSHLEVDETDTAIVSGIESSKRPAVIVKVKDSIETYKRMIRLNAGLRLIELIQRNNFSNFDDLKNSLPHKSPEPTLWENVGGQLILKNALNELLQSIKKEDIRDWHDVHEFYQKQGETYIQDKLEHAFSAYLKIENITIKDFTANKIAALLEEVIAIKENMTQQIYETRAKDHKNTFRKMVYANEKEMDVVLGSLEKNSFIQSQFKKMQELKAEITEIFSQLNLPSLSASK